MKAIIRKICVCLCGVLTLSGCGDFLEEYSQDLTYATNCNDLEELLVGGGYAVQYTNRRTGGITSAMLTGVQNGMYLPGLHVMDDDVRAVVYGQEAGVWPYELLGAYYRWAINPCNSGTQEYDDPEWQSFYMHIGVANAVIDKVDEFTDDSEEDRNRVKGQAYFLRAYYYYFLVNLYAGAYSAVSADSDLGVPLKNFSSIDDRKWERATVKEVYDQIVSDLQAAITCLAGQTPRSVYWAGEDAARLLLSRVYCYMGQWESVPAVCEPLLNKGYHLTDLVANASAPYLATDSPELIFTMGNNMRGLVFYMAAPTGLASFGVSDELWNLYGNGDVRRDVRLTNRNPSQTYQFYFPQTMGDNVSDVFTLRLSEAYLNLAEAYAMNGNEDEARQMLQELRERRIAADQVGTVTATGEELVKAIRDERRRELCFEGHRWFDLKRYGVCPNYPESKSIVHPHYEHTTGSISQEGAYVGDYVLPGYPDQNWILPIPQFEIEESQGFMEANERYEITLN